MFVKPRFPLARAALGGRPSSSALWIGMIAVFALLYCAPAHAETRVILLRGWFGVFSTGLDKIGETLKEQGIRTDVEGHLSWKAVVDDIVRERAEGKIDTLVLIGHSQGGNNVIDMARLLEAKNVPVALLITLAPFKQDPVPTNVARAINYYQSGGWGDPITAAPGFKGKLSNIDVKEDAAVSHINIDKSSRVQADIAREVGALAKSSPATEARKQR